MKKLLVRIVGSVVGLLLLVGLVPNANGVLGSRSEHLTLSIPATLKTSDLATIDSPSPELPTPVPVQASITGPVAESALVLKSAAPLSAIAPSELTAPRPTEAPVVVPADEIRLESRLARSALIARPKATTHAATVSWDVYIHLPPDAQRYAPLRVLIALHGMGGQGEKFAQSMIADADRNHWVLVAPTLPYQRDYMDPVQLREEDSQFSHVLHALIDSLPERLGLKLHRHVLIFGFSRGAQLAHRFAMFHPDYVETVAAISAGSYTMPFMNASSQVMDFPYGIANLATYLGSPPDLIHFKQISFWIVVGEKDNRSSDVSRAFDATSGQNRVERAKAFEKALESLGMDVHLKIYANAGHEVTYDMCEGALGFLRQDEVADHWND